MTHREKLVSAPEDVLTIWVLFDTIIHVMNKTEHGSGE